MKVISFVTSVCVLILIVVLATSKIGDPDTAQYLASGQYLVQNGLPRSCVYTYTLERCITVYSEWLLHLIIYGFFKIGGWEGLSILQSIVVGSTFITILLFNLRRGINILIVSTVLLLSAFAASSRFFLRADTIALLPMVLYFILNKSAYNEDFKNTGKITKKRIYLMLFLVQVIWTNIHGSFVLAFAIAFSNLFPDLIRLATALFSGKKIESTLARRLKTGAYIVLTTFAASILNPYGFNAFIWPFTNTLDTMGKLLVSTIAEYQSPFNSRFYRVYYVNAYKVLVYFSVSVLILQIRRVRIAELCIFLLFLVLSIQGVRYSAGFAVITALILPYYVQHFLRRFNRFLFKKSISKQVAPFVYFCLAIILCAIFIILAPKFINNTFYIEEAAGRRFGLGKSNLDYPEKAVEFVKRNKIPGNMFNSYGFGGYLNFSLYPEYKTFIHGAVLDFDITDTVWLYRNYLDINTAEASYKDVVKKYGINFFLLNHRSDTATYLIVNLFNDREWKMIYIDDNSVIFLADTPENKDLISKYFVDYSLPGTEIKNGALEKMPYYDRAFAYNAMGIFFSKLDLLLSAKIAYEHSLNSYPSYITYSNIGVIYSRLGLSKEAEVSFRKSIELDDSLATSHYRYGVFLSDQNRLDAALEQFQKAFMLDKNFTEAQREILNIKNKKSF